MLRSIVLDKVHLFKMSPARPEPAGLLRFQR